MKLMGILGEASFKGVFVSNQLLCPSSGDMSMILIKPNESSNNVASHEIWERDRCVG